MGDKSPESKSFADQVSETVTNMTQGEDGKWQLPEGVADNEALAFAAITERRRRDTQSAYTQGQVKLKQIEAENKHLAEGYEATFTKQLTAKEQADLEELKATDPDAWHAKLNTIAEEKRNAFQETRKEIATKAAGETEADYRNRALQEFVSANPEVKLTDDIIKNDIPPRITNKLASGDITFGEFLNQCGDYLAKGKVVQPTGDKAPNNPNLAEQPGGSAPDGDAVKQAAKNSYDSEIY